MNNEQLRNSAYDLSKDLEVLKLCLQECGKGSSLSRNPYLRSPHVKGCLQALHESIERVIQSVLKFSGEYTKFSQKKQKMQAYYKTYYFLFDFNDGIRREEYDHLLLIKDKDMLAKFNKLFYQSAYLIDDILHQL